MSTNPFSEWPFWHYYSLHIQNAPFIDEEIRNINPGPLPIAYSALNTRAQGNVPDGYDMRTLPSIQNANTLINVINNSFFYDFINDRIVRGNDLDKSKVWIVTPTSFGPRTISTIPSDATIIVKGIAREGRGGDIMPLVASPANMIHIFQALGPAQAIARGETTDREGRPVQRYDILSALSAQERERLQGLLARPLYQNTTIATILQSFKRQTSASSDMERNAARIRNQLTKVIPEEKAINVTSGALVNATAPCYNVFEMQVVVPGTNDFRTVKFAFKTNMRDDERQAYDRLIRERFRAQEVQTAQVAIDQRRAISLQPIRASFRDYENLFRSNEGFQTYIQRINEATTTQNIDSSQVLHSEVTENEEDEYNEEYTEEDEFDVSEL